MSNDHLAQVLRKYAHTSQTKAARDAVVQPLLPVIYSWAGNHINQIQYSGSHAKGTSIKGGTDIDLFISMKSTTPGGMADLYNSLFNALHQKGFNPRKQNVSIGVTINGAKIDLVPAKQQDGRSGDHALYRTKASTWTKTNIDTHIQSVTSSGRIDEIRILKIWRNRFGLDFPSFYLELSVIEALKGKRAAFADNVITALRYLKSDFQNRRIVDPANTNNIISDDLNNTEKQKISQLAARALSGSWEDFVA